MSIIEKRQHKIMVSLGFKMRRGNRFNPNPDTNGTWWDHPSNATLFLYNNDDTITEKRVVSGAICSAIAKHHRKLKLSISETFDSLAII